MPCILTLRCNFGRQICHLSHKNASAILQRDLRFENKQLALYNGFRSSLLCVHSLEEPLVPVSFGRPISSPRFGPITLRHVDSLSCTVKFVAVLFGNSPSVAQFVQRNLAQHSLVFAAVRQNGKQIIA